MFQDKLSPIYEPLLPASILQLEVPKERFADCMNCFHCNNENNPAYQNKCCSYHPVLPNYMVGAILSDDSPAMAEGRSRILEKIKNRIGVTPYGIVPPMAHHKKYTENFKINKRKVQTKADAAALQCPYQSADSLCTIWKYRTELCSTYHCVSSSGQKGKQFWNTAYQYLRSIERKLTLYALQQQGYPALATITQMISPPTFQLENKEGVLKEKVYQQLWKQWEGQEMDYYIACYAHIQALNPEKVEALFGIEEAVQFQKLEIQATKMVKHSISDFLQLDTTHPQYLALQKDKQITLANGRLLRVNLLQLTFLKLFKGTMPTLEVIQKSFTVKQGIGNLLLPLLKLGILKRV